MTTQVCCDRCGQLTAYVPDEHFYEDVLCGRCKEADRAPQGEAVRLFTPAPAQMPGQTMFGDLTRAATSYGAVHGLPREPGEDPYGLS